MSRKWKGNAAGDPEDWWMLEIESDCFDPGGPLVVSLWVETPEEAKGSLAVLSPAEAREAASALNRVADECDRQSGPVETQGAEATKHVETDHELEAGRDRQVRGAGSADPTEHARAPQGPETGSLGEGELHGGDATGPPALTDHDDGEAGERLPEALAPLAQTPDLAALVIAAIEVAREEGRSEGIRGDHNRERLEQIASIIGAVHAEDADPRFHEDDARLVRQLAISLGEGER